MRITADMTKCQGYGNCVAEDADHFDLDDVGLVVVVEPTVAPGDVERVQAAVRSCPVAALRTVDDD